MSYDLYCYRPRSEDAAEAEALIERFNAAEENGEYHENSPDVREKPCRRPEATQSRLERFSFDYAKIAESLKTSEEEARARYQHAELNTPAGIPLRDHLGNLLGWNHLSDQSGKSFSHIPGLDLVGCAVRYGFGEGTVGKTLWKLGRSSPTDGNALTRRQDHSEFSPLYGLPRSAGKSVIV